MIIPSVSLADDDVRVGENGFQIEDHHHVGRNAFQMTLHLGRNSGRCRIQVIRPKVAYLVQIIGEQRQFDFLLVVCLVGSHQENMGLVGGRTGRKTPEHCQIHNGVDPAAQVYDAYDEAGRTRDA